MGAGPPGTPISPWVYSALDYQKRALTITVTFNNNTLALTGCTVTRDPGCLYQHIYLGLGADGTPESSATVFTVPSGTITQNANQLSKAGFNTINDVLAQQVTAGP